MIEMNMPVTIFRGPDEIGTGELLPNGPAMALCPDDHKFELFEFMTDTAAVEDKIPMKFFCDELEISDGELYNSGDYICLCPLNQDLNLVAPLYSATLFVEPHGLNARFDISTKKH